MVDHKKHWVEQRLRYSLPRMAQPTSSSQVCRTLIPTAFAGSDAIRFQYALGIYNNHSTTWIAFLFMSLPNVKELAIKPATDDMPGAYAAFLRHYHYGSRLILSAWPDLFLLLQTYTEARLKILTATAPSDLYGPISVSHLENLKVLIIEGKCLRPPNFTGTELVKAGYYTILVPMEVYHTDLSLFKYMVPTSLCLGNGYGSCNGVKHRPNLVSPDAIFL